MDLDVDGVEQVAGTGAVPRGTYIAGEVELPPELVAQVDPDDADFVSNDRLREILAGTDATPARVDTAVALNEEARLRALRLGLLVLAGVSALAVVPASRVPDYRPGEVPESVATGAAPAPARSRWRHRDLPGQRQSTMISSIAATIRQPSTSRTVQARSPVGAAGPLASRR